MHGAFYMFGAFAPHAKAWTAAFKPAREAAGGKVVAEHPMSYNPATDFYSGVSRMLAAKYADGRWRPASEALTRSVDGLIRRGLTTL